ncbi:hypothetical protein MHBO_004295, partial [Bonamia ostreae]
TKIKSISCGAHTVYAISLENILFSSGLDNFGQLGRKNKNFDRKKSFSRCLQKVLSAKTPNLPQKRKPDNTFFANAKKVCGGTHHCIVLTTKVPNLNCVKRINCIRSEETLLVCSASKQIRKKRNLKMSNQKQSLHLFLFRLKKKEKTSQ